MELSYFCTKVKSVGISVSKDKLANILDNLVRDHNQVVSSTMIILSSVIHAVYCIHSTKAAKSKNWQENSRSKLIIIDEPRFCFKYMYTALGLEHAQSISLANYDEP